LIYKYDVSLHGKAIDEGVATASDILVMKFFLVLVLVSFFPIIFILFSFSLLKCDHFSFYLVFPGLI